MTAQWTSQVSESDARSLTEKLAAFSKTLSDGEREALSMAINQSMQKSSDVQGYASWDATNSEAWWGWWNQTWAAEGW